MRRKIKLFLVDDDAVFKVIRNRIIHHTDFIVETYATGELCLANLDKKPDVIILTTIWTELIKRNEWD
jgi:FixJ family two-component response regulator